jgi:hypothetical protein
VVKKGNCWPEPPEFLSPWGSREDKKSQVTLREFSFHAKRILRVVAGPSIPLISHQGEREKNEYSYDAKNTAKLPKSMEIKL